MKCFSCHCKDKIKKENLFHTMICERNRCDKNLADPQRFTTHISFLYDIFNYIYSHKHASELNTFTRTIILHKSNVCFTSPKHKIMFLPVLQLVLTSTRAAHSSAVGTTGQRVTWVMKGMCVCKMLPYAKASWGPNKVSVYTLTWLRKRKERQLSGQFMKKILNLNVSAILGIGFPYYSLPFGVTIPNARRLEVEDTKPWRWVGCPYLLDILISQSVILHHEIQ